MARKQLRSVTFPGLPDTYTIETKGPIKILGIGNSYTRDSFRWLWQILTDAGYEDVIVGHGYHGHYTLVTQYDRLVTHPTRKSYQYWKYSDAYPEENPKKYGEEDDGWTLGDIIDDEPWDIVVFQQQSDYAGMFESFVYTTRPEWAPSAWPDAFDVADLVNEVKRRIKTRRGSDPLIALNSTWSHSHITDEHRDPSTGEVDYPFVRTPPEDADPFIRLFAGDPDYQLWCVNNTIRKVADHLGGVDFIVNAGTAVQLARADQYLGVLGYEMLRADQIHILRGIPEFMVSYLFAATLCGVTSDEVTWFPTDEDNPDVPDSGVYPHPSFHPNIRNATLASIAKRCADAAKDAPSGNIVEIHSVTDANGNLWRWTKFKNFTVDLSARISVTPNSWDTSKPLPLSELFTVTPPFPVTTNIIQANANNTCLVVNPSTSSGKLRFRLIALEQPTAGTSVSVNLHLNGIWSY